MGQKIDDDALDTLFREARTYSKWQSKRVSHRAATVSGGNIKVFCDHGRKLIA
jgi:hypothetical protein